ncbi:pyrroloquinoline quinone precursor peptide PqqA [Micrococcaceae bacterium RIT802]|jgi:coenzyme PQQ precursor peptide PqqA|nr:pyrroloquinoline quinone precursor peptide PqqA [Micrococcaceae bacterium RIT 802]MBM6621059.1 pyrroloquinoline quinone precursor peptide PqqA [Micrococcaceae bacterium RIT 802]
MIVNNNLLKWESPVLTEIRVSAEVTAYAGFLDK